MELRFWCGKAGGLKAETSQLILHLRAILNGEDRSLVLAPSRTKIQGEDCDWLGGTEWKEFPGAGGFLTLYTSGTTSQPKPVTKDFIKSFHSKRGQACPGSRWILTYNPYRWAGISMITHVLRTQAELVVPNSLEVQDILQALPKANQMSITPSLFRKLILADTSDILRSAKLTQITFGGEVAPQSVLDLAKAYWPTARITHVYASTEHGDICGVSDGREGVPAEKWKAHAFTSDGELVINGQPTGDIWSLREGRYYFKGRVQEVANVGGAKVFLSSVEQEALSIKGVLHARAFSVPSALLGQLVALEYVGEINRRELSLELRKRLPKVSWPAKVEKVESIHLNEAGKIRRS